MPSRKEPDVFRRIVIYHVLQVGWVYASGRCSKSEYQCAREYLKGLQKRVHKHDKRLVERN